MIREKAEVVEYVLPRTKVKSSLVILACPFCDSVWVELEIDGAAMYIRCTHCGAQGPVGSDASETIGRWNRFSDSE